MSRFTDLAGPTPDPLPGFPGVHVRHGTLEMHRDLTLTLAGSQDAQAAEAYAGVADRIHQVQERIDNGDALNGAARAEISDELADIRLAVGTAQELRRFDSDQVFEDDRRVLQLLFDAWLVDAQGQPFSDVTGPDPEKDVAGVASATLISATLAHLKRRQEGNVEPAGTS